MEAIKEVTDWKGVTRQPNHTYLMDGAKAVAYAPWHTGPVFWFKVPKPIDRRYRKFEKGDASLFETDERPAPVPQVIKVAGSKGNFYYVDPDAKSCTCPGFTFRATCKHLEMV